MRRYFEKIISPLNVSREIELVGAVELNYWRERVLNNFILLSLPLGIIAIASLIYMQTYSVNILWVGIFTYTGLLALYFLKNLPLIIRMFALLSILLFAGMGSLYNFGPLSPGLIILFTFTVLGIIFFEQKKFYYLIILNLLIVSGLHVLKNLNMLPVTFPLDIPNELCLSISINYMVLVSLSGFALMTIIDGLSRTIKTECMVQQMLEKEQLSLFRAKLKAEEADRLKSSFLANMSHEIRTPLNGILGFTDIIRREDLSDVERDEYLNIIHTNGTQLLRLINDIIDFSKIEVNQLEIKASEFCLNEMFYELEKQYQKQLSISDNKNLVLSWQQNGMQDVTLVADQYRIRQVLTNLIDNAVKFTKEGHIFFWFELMDHKMVKFIVEDTGIGIAKDKTEVIFNRFHQLETFQTKEHGGTGLGLAICKSLVEMMGGEIAVESIQGEGSKFYFTVSQYVALDKNP